MATSIEKEDYHPTVKELVKCDKDGNTDWKTLGNILAASLLGEVCSASYADSKYGRKNSGEESLKVETDWKFAFKEDSVYVFKKQPQKHTSNITSWMGRGIIDLPVNEVAEVIHEAESFKKWNKFMTESTLIRILSESETHRDLIGYFCHENAQCFVSSKRDFALFIHSEYMDGKYIQTGISIEHPECPVVEGITRAEACLGCGWVLEPYGDGEQKTLASYSMNINFKSPLPPVIMNRVLRRQPLTLHYMRMHVMKVKKTKAKKSSSVEVPVKENLEDADLVSLAVLKSTAEDSNSHRNFLCDSSKHFEDTVGVAEFTGSSA